MFKRYLIGFLLLFCLLLSSLVVSATLINGVDYQENKPIVGLTNSNLAFYLNSTHGFQSQEILFNPSITTGSLNLYYNNYTSYTLYDEVNSRVIPYITTSKAEGFNESNVFSTNAKAVYTFNDYNTKQYTNFGTEYIEGHIGGGVDISTLNYNIRSKEKYDIGEDTTLTWWMNSSSTSAGFIFYYSPSFNYNGISAYYSGGFIIKSGSTTHNCGTGITYTDKKWRHYAFTRNNTDVELYINGSLVCNASIPSINGIGSDWFRIGDAFGNTNHWGIDDFRLFEKRLSINEMNYIYNNGIGNQDNNIISTESYHLTFESGSDLTTNENHLDFISTTNTGNFSDNKYIVSTPTEFKLNQQVTTENSPISMVMDIKLDGSFHGGTQYIIGQGDQSQGTNSKGLNYWIDGAGDFKFSYTDSGTTTNYMATIPFSQIDYNQNYNLIVTADTSSGIKVYVNGNLNQSDSIGTSNTPSGSYTPPYFGRCNQDAGCGISFYTQDIESIDEIRFYDKVLSPTEIDELYDNTQIQLNNYFALNLTNIDMIIKNATTEKLIYKEFEPIYTFINWTSTDGTKLNSTNSYCNLTSSKYDNVIMSYNVAISLWELSNYTIYTDKQNDTLIGECRHNTISGYNNDIQRNIIINNIAPRIEFNTVETPTIYDLNINKTIEYTGAYWYWDIDVSDNDIDYINYTFSASNGSQIWSQENTTSDIIVTPNGTFKDFDYAEITLSVYAIDTDLDSSYAEYKFNVTDVTLPYCNGFSNETVLNNTNYDWNINCYDESFFKWNVTCDNNYTYLDTGLDVRHYQFTESMLITSDTYCHIEYCDGHTAQGIPDFVIGKETSSFERTVNNKITFSMDKPFRKFDFIKEYDRYKFYIEPLNPRQDFIFTVSSDEFIHIGDQSTYMGWLIVGDYWIDFVNNDIESLLVQRINDNSVQITITFPTMKSSMTFNSIGELNCKENDVLITSTTEVPTIIDGLINEQTCPLDQGFSYTFGFFAIIAFLMIILLLNETRFKIPLLTFLLGFAFIFISIPIWACSVFISLPFSFFGVFIMVREFTLM